MDNNMNFYETQMGRNFFEVQLPRLIQVLEDISVSLLRKTESVTLPIEIPENFLEEFYYGNLEIGACSGETCSNHHLKEIISIQDELQAQLTPEQWALFRKCIRFLYKGIIIKHNKTEPTYTKTSLFLCEKRRFFMARTEKGVVATI